MKSIQKQYLDAIDQYMQGIKGMDDAEKEKARLNLQYSKLKDSPDGDRILNKKTQGIRKDIQRLENDIAMWENNLGFFANSKTANKLQEEFNAKIEKAQEEVKKLKGQLKALRNL